MFLLQLISANYLILNTYMMFRGTSKVVTQLGVNISHLYLAPSMPYIRVPKGGVQARERLGWLREVCQEVMG